MGDHRTLSVAGDVPSEEERRVPWLFHVLSCDDVSRPTAAFSLAGVTEVEIRRGPGGGEREGARLTVKVDDARVSELHARLSRGLAGWELADAGSKNGCLVGGVRVTRTLLEDGDDIEVGHSIFRFRENLSAADVEAPDELPTLLPALRAAFHRLAQVAPSMVPVIILGESGTGKERVARALHEHSGRRGDLVAVNCGAIPANLVESQLFGHKRGAFSGALEESLGLVRAADQGTLFLDEIGDLPLLAQTPLLRVLQENEVLPVGAVRPVKVQARVVCATHRDLQLLVGQGLFRQDLYNRLVGFAITLPPLRERLEDLGLLLSALVAARGLARVALHPQTARCLLSYTWPGNVRELDKLIEAAVPLAGGKVILPAHIPPAVAASLDLPLGVDDARQRDDLVALLKKHKGNIAAVARELGKARTQVHRWLKRFALDVESYR